MKQRALFDPVGGAPAPSAAPDRYSHPIDAPLRRSIEDKAIAGVVAMATDREGVFYRGAFHVSGKRSAGSLSWGGISNTYFWVDRSRGVAGVILMQFLPFADPQALAVYDGFERGVYRLADAM
jgi:CubicO group peptidase (beta-lactamase class C family)